MIKRIAASVCAATVVFGTAGYMPQKAVVGQGAITACAGSFDEETSSWEDDDYDSDFYYTTIEDEGVEIYGYKHKNTSTEVIIPETIDGLPVTRIGNNAFENCPVLTSVSIPDSVIYIGHGAFNYCTSLESVDIPDSVEEIDVAAFVNCASLTSVKLPKGIDTVSEQVFANCVKLKNVEIPEGVTTISFNAFSGCSSLTDVTLPNGLTRICRDAFSVCRSLEKINIPASVTSIEKAAFANCIKLKSIDVDEKNSNYSSDDGVLFNKDKTALLQYPSGKTDESYSIPESVTNIGISAFTCADKLTGVTIPDSVSSIGEYAFISCKNLENITIPEDITDIGYGAFGSTKWLENQKKADPLVVVNGILIDGTACEGYITIPDGVTSISRYAFYTATDLNGVTIPDSVTSISDHAFYECINLRSVTLPKGIESIEDHLFYNCRKLSEIVIPDGVGVIKEYAFSKCESLTSAVIPNSVTKIGDHAFYECINLKNTVIPNGVVTIDEYAFCGCLSLTSAEISDSVAEIGAFSFSFNPNLKGVKLSKGLKCISYGAFVECENLTDVYYNGSKKQWDAVSIDDYNPSLLSAKIHFDGAVKVNPEFICQKGTNAVKLSWDEVEGAEMYGIAGFAEGKWKLLDKTTDTSYIINNLKAGQNYKVAVVAMFGGEWCMDLSKAQTVTPKQEATALYPKVYVHVKDGKIGIKWDKVTGAEKYGIGVYQNNKWKVVKQLDGSITRWTSPQVRSGKYKMVVLAKVNGQWVTADVFKKSVYVTVN